MLHPRPLLKVTGQAMLKKSSSGVGIEAWHSDRRRRNGFLLFSLASPLLPVSFDPAAPAAPSGCDGGLVLGGGVNLWLKSSLRLSEEPTAGPHVLQVLWFSYC